MNVGMTEEHLQQQEERKSSTYCSRKTSPTKDQGQKENHVDRPPEERGKGGEYSREMMVHSIKD